MKTPLALIIALFGAAQLHAQPGSELEKIFAKPPHAAKPRTYWFHMSGQHQQAGHYGGSGGDAGDRLWRHALMNVVSRCRPTWSNGRIS